MTKLLTKNNTNTGNNKNNNYNYGCKKYDKKGKNTRKISKYYRKKERKMSKN